MMLFSVTDYVAVTFLLVSVLGITWIIEHPPRKHPSTHILMRQYRIGWMQEMAARDVRIFDAQVLSNLRQGASFFASTTLISLGGGAAILGQAERVEALAADLDASLSAPIVVWEIKILLAMTLLGMAFLKFVWSIRLFGYCAVLMAAVPNDGSTARAKAVANTAGEINVLADRSFTRALRSVYFALAALAWFGGAWALIAATTLTLLVIWRREFASRTRKLLAEMRLSHPEN